jgi:1-pyrroline-5-carboxylate dehydrogenase
MSFKLTYATMFDPPEELHDRYEAALDQVRANLGQQYGMIINNEDRFATNQFKSKNPANTDEILGYFQTGTTTDANEAIAAARAAFLAWSALPYQGRLDYLYKVADLIDARVYEIAAAISLEVGKNRMEALGDIAETAELIRYACDQVAANDGFVVEMGKDPLNGYTATNVSVLKPYGVWLVISPFNFPAALSGGPVGAALAAGNTIVLKPATDTPWTVRLLAECFRDAGLPNGVFNFVTGPGRTLGQALIDNPEVDGVTFTGSYDVGMGIYRDFANGKYVRPIILELGGKNPTIVSRNADLERAATGIVRSAFGLQGQKCSACSRIYVEEPVYAELVEKIMAKVKTLKLGNPTDKDVYLGPVANSWAFKEFKEFTAELKKSGSVLFGGETPSINGFENGYFCESTLVADVPLDHKLWKQEMFLPISMITKVNSLEEAMDLANDVEYGLTAGFYGSKEETKWFFDNTQAGVNYANRPQGATTGAWPGFQPFGGWKGSGSSGKNAGGHYYVQLYMHEQIHTLID